MAIAELEVQSRSALGKSAVKKMRTEGLVPAVLYGEEVESTPLAVNEHTLNRFFEKYGQSMLVSLGGGHSQRWLVAADKAFIGNQMLAPGNSGNA